MVNDDDIIESLLRVVMGLLLRCAAAALTVT
jgi:hypothetical protein